MPQRILFITSNRLGDAVLTTGLYRALALTAGQDGGLPAMTVACGPLAAPLFAAAPGLERLIVLRKRPLARHWLGLWQQVVGTRWDLVVDLRDSVVSRLVPAGRRLVLSGRDSRVASGRHKVEVLAHLAGLESPPAPCLWLDDASRQAAATAIGEGDGRPLLALAPTANWLGKEWPSDRFVALARRLVAAEGPLAGGRVMVVAAPGERERAQAVLSAFAPSDRVDMIGRGDALAAAAALAQADLFVGNDSGLMHMAAALGVPTVGLFGPGLPDVYGPWGRHCRVVCSTVAGAALRERVRLEGDPRDLMDGIAVDAVYAAASALWTQHVRDGEGMATKA